MTKLRILVLMTLAILFLLSLWVCPIALVAAAFMVSRMMWVKIAAIVMAVIWLILIRPWTLFGQPRFGRFVNDVRCAVKALLS